MYNLGRRQWLGGLSSPMQGGELGNVACFHPGALRQLQQDGVTKMENDSNGTFTT